MLHLQNIAALRANDLALSKTLAERANTFILDLQIGENALTRAVLGGPGGTDCSSHPMPVVFVLSLGPIWLAVLLIDRLRRRLVRIPSHPG